MQIEGKFNSENEPEIKVKISGIKKSTSFIIDTGFSGTLWLPEKVINQTDFSLITMEKFTVADEREINCKVYIGEII